MYKATVLYGYPRDVEAFDVHYEQVHIPLARKMQGIAHWTITKGSAGPNGVTPPFYLIAELYTPSRAQLFGAFSSPEGLAAAADVATFADGGAQFFFGDEQTVTTTEFFQRRR